MKLQPKSDKAKVITLDNYDGEIIVKKINGLLMLDIQKKLKELEDNKDEAELLNYIANLISQLTDLGTKEEILELPFDDIQEIFTKIVDMPQKENFTTVQTM